MNKCKFCGVEIKEDEESGKWWDRDGGRFYDICLKCAEKIKNL